MKYLQLVAATSPIESWLHSQLEARGVDRVYSRYILSLFHSNDVQDHDFLDLDIPSKELKRLNKKKYHSLSHSTSRSQEARLKLVRASVIETLRSVAETKAGIETLVDELCSRLHSNEARVPSDEKNNGSLVSALSLNNVCVVPDVDLAQKYYDAFPALDSNPQPSAPRTQLLTSTPWNGNHASLLSASADTPADQKEEAIPETPCGEDVKSGAKRVTFSGNSAKLETSSDAANVVTSSDVVKVVTSSDVVKVVTSSDVVKVVTSSDAANVVTSSDAANVVTSSDAANVVTSSDAANVVASSGDTEKQLGAQDKQAPKMDCSLRVKRKLFVDVEDQKDSLAYLMERVDGIKDLWESDISPSSSCSSLLPPIPLVAPPLGSGGFIPCGTNLTTSIWSEVEWGGGGGKWSDDSGVCMTSPLEEDATAVTSESRIKPVLNHCPESSAFQPVILGSKLPPVTSFPPPPPSQAIEENLLTSARTHFCPIDKAPHYKTHTNNVQYANGTTFSIMSQLDDIDYHVGQDGTLTWDSGTYMEFKANGLNTECYNLYDPFKPKFRVISVCKSIQTDGSGGEDGSEEQQEEEENMEDFYFPGEDSIARDIMRSLEEAEDVKGEGQHISLSQAPLSPMLLDAWAVAWPPFSIWSNTALAAKVGDGWPPPSHDYQELSKPPVSDVPHTQLNSCAPPPPAPGVYANYSIWAPPFPLDSNSNVILCATKCETPLPLGVNMGNLKISSDRKRRHSSSQFAGALSTFPCIKSEVSFFQQSITL